MANTACLEEAVQGMLEREERREKLAVSEVLDRRPSPEWYFVDEIIDRLKQTDTTDLIVLNQSSVSTILNRRGVPRCKVLSFARTGRDGQIIPLLCYHITDWNIFKRRPVSIGSGINRDKFPEGVFNASDVQKFWGISHQNAVSQLNRSCFNGSITRIRRGVYRKAEPTELPLEVSA